MKKIQPDVQKGDLKINMGKTTAVSPSEQARNGSENIEQSDFTNMSIPYKKGGAVLDAGFISSAGTTRPAAEAEAHPNDSNEHSRSHESNGDTADAAHASTNNTDAASVSTAATAPGAVQSPLPEDIAKSLKQTKSTRRKGTVLICFGVLLLILAGVFFASSLMSAPKSVYAVESNRYDVPDGLLQEGTVDSATNVVYLYDLEGDSVPYAVEYHAVEKGLLGEEDLYESWNGEDTFDDATKGEDVALDVQNFRKIVVHLPEEARGYVAGSDDAELNTAKIDDQQPPASEEDANDADTEK